MLAQEDPRAIPAASCFARVSAADQKVVSQIDDLMVSDCGRASVDEGDSGGLAHRSALDQVSVNTRRVGTVIFVRLDCLDRSLRSPVELVNDLAASRVGFASPTERIDTTTSSRLLVLGVLSSLTES